MKRANRFFLVIASEKEQAELLELGVELPNGVKTPLGALVGIDMEEDDPRWERFQALLRRRLEVSAVDARTKELSCDTGPRLKAERIRN